MRLLTQQHRWNSVSLSRRPARLPLWELVAHSKRGFCLQEVLGLLVACPPIWKRGIGI